MPNPGPSPWRFSERETGEYYDAEDALYRSFRDAEGSLHRGTFDALESPGGGVAVRGDFLTAGSRRNAIRPENAGTGEKAQVLDLGCGDGNPATRVAAMGTDPERFTALSGACLNPALTRRWSARCATRNRAGRSTFASSRPTTCRNQQRSNLW